MAEKPESPLQVPKTQSAFHSHAQRNAFVAEVCIHNPDRSPFAMQSCHPAESPSGFAETS
jgi:hypothetical protein